MTEQQQQQQQMELMAVKARGFDLVMQIDMLQQQQGQLRHILSILAHKLGVTDLNKFDVNTLPELLDSKLNHEKTED